MTLSALVHAYLGSLELGLASVSEPVERTHYYERLAAAGEMAAAVEGGDFGRAASIAETESHALGWTMLSGRLGPVAHQQFHDFEQALLAERLRLAREPE